MSVFFTSMKNTNLFTISSKKKEKKNPSNLFQSECYYLQCIYVILLFLLSSFLPSSGLYAYMTLAIFLSNSLICSI